MLDVARRHARTEGSDGARFGLGDTLHQKTAIKTDHDTVRGIEQRGIEERPLLGKNSSNVRGNKIQGISSSNQKNETGRMRLSSADKLLQGRKVSELPTIQEIHYEDTPYRK